MVKVSEKYKTWFIVAGTIAGATAGAYLDKQQDVVGKLPIMTPFGAFLGALVFWFFAD